MISREEKEGGGGVGGEVRIVGGAVKKKEEEQPAATVLPQTLPSPDTIQASPDTNTNTSPDTSKSLQTPPNLKG